MSTPELDPRTDGAPPDSAGVAGSGLPEGAVDRRPGSRALGQPEWSARREAHRQRVDAWIEPHLDRRQRGERHPVYDFLFSYYSLRPARLRRWHPGLGIALTGTTADQLLEESGYVDYRRTGRGVELDPVVAERRADSIGWIHRLLTATQGRPAHLGCFGLHEWAMVYRQPEDEIRHAGWPLRLGSAGTDRVVERNRVRCSHFDAYRFFTEPARPMNTLQPTRERQPELENPGCLHVNMDLYKWAYKLLPLIPSELLADCFELSREIRVLDMRASPYDLSELGFTPVPIETPEGRAEYAAAQRAFAERAEPLRDLLIAWCTHLLRAIRTTDLLDPTPEERQGDSAHSAKQVTTGDTEAPGGDAPATSGQ